MDPPMAPQMTQRTNLPDDAGMAALERKAAEAAAMLKLLANENRLLILCRLALKGEMAVRNLVDAVGLSQSALSQHLAKMREEACSPPGARHRRCSTASPIRTPPGCSRC